MTGRRVIPPGEQERPLDVLAPIVELLIERGHPPIAFPDKLGFRPSPSGWVCSLEGAITPEDWAAVNEHFDLPETITYVTGAIRDTANWVDIEGAAPIRD
jgi:hypothetical protein